MYFRNLIQLSMSSWLGGSMTSFWRSIFPSCMNSLTCCVRAEYDGAVVVVVQSQADVCYVLDVTDLVLVKEQQELDEFCDW